MFQSNDFDSSEEESSYRVAMLIIRLAFSTENMKQILPPKLDKLPEDIAEIKSLLLERDEVRATAFFNALKLLDSSQAYFNENTETFLKIFHSNRKPNPKPSMFVFYIKTVLDGHPIADLYAIVFLDKHQQFLNSSKEHHAGPLYQLLNHTDELAGHLVDLLQTGMPHLYRYVHKNITPKIFQSALVTLDKKSKTYPLIVLARHASIAEIESVLDSFEEDVQKQIRCYPPFFQMLVSNKHLPDNHRLSMYSDDELTTSLTNLFGTVADTRGGEHPLAPILLSTSVQFIKRCLKLLAKVDLSDLDLLMQDGSKRNLLHYAVINHNMPWQDFFNVFYKKSKNKADLNKPSLPPVLKQCLWQADCLQQLPIHLAIKAGGARNIKMLLIEMAKAPRSCQALSRYHPYEHHDDTIDTIHGQLLHMMMDLTPDLFTELAVKKNLKILFGENYIHRQHETSSLNASVASREKLKHPEFKYCLAIDLDDTVIANKFLRHTRFTELTDLKDYTQLPHSTSEEKDRVYLQRPKFKAVLRGVILHHDYRLIVMTHSARSYKDIVDILVDITELDEQIVQRALLGWYNRDHQDSQNYLNFLDKHLYLVELTPCIYNIKIDKRKWLQIAFVLNQVGVMDGITFKNNIFETVLLDDKDDIVTQAIEHGVTAFIAEFLNNDLSALSKLISLFKFDDHENDCEIIRTVAQAYKKTLDPNFRDVIPNVEQDLNSNIEELQLTHSESEHDDSDLHDKEKYDDSPSLLDVIRAYQKVISPIIYRSN